MGFVSIRPRFNEPIEKISGTHIKMVDWEASDMQSHKLEQADDIEQDNRANSGSVIGASSSAFLPSRNSSPSKANKVKAKVEVGGDDTAAGLSSGVKRKKRDWSSAHVSSLENVRTKNSAFWAPKAVLEWTTVMNICWYIKYEMLRSRMLPSMYNGSSEQMQPLPSATESDILAKSRYIYNQLYRNDEYRRVSLVPSSSGSTSMKVGSIEYYDKFRKMYAVAFDNSRGKSQLHSPANLTCLGTPNSSRPKERKATTCSVEITNWDSDADNPLWRVKFERNLMTALEAASGGQNLPNENSYSLYCSEMSKRDERETLIKLKAECDLAEHRAHLTDMRRTLHVQTEMNKAKRRTLSNQCTAKKYEDVLDLLYSNTAALKKSPPLWNSMSEKVEFVRFGFPFKTTDKSLGSMFGIMDHLLGRRTDLFRFGHDHLNEDAILNHFRKDVQGISPSSVEALEPGHCLGDEIVNLFLQM